MTRKAHMRFKAYKEFLVRRIYAMKNSAYLTKLKRITAKEIGEYAKERSPGISFTNVARDIRMLTSPGENYDPEFDLLLRGQVLPEVIERYSATFLAKLVKGVIAPSDLDRALVPIVRCRPDGRRLWEET